jgi:FixJ family two-component response regulator
VSSPGRAATRAEALREAVEIAASLPAPLLVAEGHTNREIGAALFISEKTASVHLSRILAKLGVRSRVEAATVAHRLGLIAASAPGDGGRG